MKRIASIFIALSLCTLPCFAENNTISFNIKGQFITDRGSTPNGLKVKIKEPAECKFESSERTIMREISGGQFKDTIICPAGTTDVTLEFISDQGNAVSTPKYQVEKPVYQIKLNNSKSYEIPDVKLKQITQIITEPTNDNQPALLSDCTERIDNAARAIYTKKDKKIECTLKECKCGYEIQDDKCVSWNNPPPTCDAKNAQTAYKGCKNGKEVCIIDTCKEDTPVLNKEKNKCEKCPQGQEPDGQGQCKKTAARQKKEDKESAIEDLLLVTCEEVNNERGTVSANCTNGKITVKCAGAKTGGTVNNQEHGKVICPNTKSNITFNIEVIESKEVTNAKDKETTATTTAKRNLTALKSALDKALETIKENQIQN